MGNASPPSSPCPFQPFAPHKPALVEAVDFVATFKGAEPVCNHEDSELVGERGNGLHDGGFGFVGEGTGGLVKDEHVGVVVESAGNAGTLALAPERRAPR